MKVIAQRGPGYLMVQTRTVEGINWGRIWNLAKNEMSQEMPVESMARFGYWTDYTGPAMTTADFEGARLMNPPVRGGT